VAPKKTTVTATSKTTRTKKPESKAAADPKPDAVKPKKKAAASAQSASAKSITPKLVVLTQNSTSPLEEISDLLNLLPIQACVELTRRLLTSVSSLPKGAAHPRGILKTVIVLVAEYASMPYEDDAE
jgi:hypothetical protein